MTIAVDLGRKATKTNKTNKLICVTRHVVTISDIILHMKNLIPLFFNKSQHMRFPPFKRTCSCADPDGGVHDAEVSS